MKLGGPFSREAASQNLKDYKAKDRVHSQWNGKGTITEIGPRGMSIKWDNGDVSNPMVGSAMLSKDRGISKIK